MFRSPCTGRVDREKGVHALADAWERSRAQGVELPVLVVAGEVVHPLASSSGVLVLGALAADELQAMAACTTLVHPSPFESFGMVLTEAWAQPDVGERRLRRSRGPVSAQRRGTGVRDLPELGEMLRAFGEDAELRTAVGERGRRYVLAQLRWDDVLDRYEQLLATVVVGPGVDPGTSRFSARRSTN